jgi:hypothetical protein
LSIKIDVTGLKEVQNFLDQIKDSVDPNVFANWADTVVRTAKQICNDPECKCIKLKHTQGLRIEFEFMDKGAIDCVINAIKQHLSSMPFPLAEIYKHTINELENRKKQFEST